MLNLNQVSQFLQITRSGSMTAAAAELGVSAPALSKSLALLEQQLGTRLFDRVGRGLQLTAFGAQFVQEARQLLGHAEEVFDRAAQRANGQAGRIRIGCGPAALHGPIASLVAPALMLSSRLQLEISSGNTASLLPRLDDHSLDFLVTDPGSLGNLADTGRYRITPLQQEEVIFVASPQHPTAQQSSVALAELLEYVWVAPQIPEHYLQVMRQRLQQEQASADAYARLNRLPDIQLDNISSCLRIAASTHYVTATLSSNYQRGFIPYALRPLPIELRLPTNISIIQLSQHTTTPAASRIMDLLLNPQSSGVYQMGAV